MSDEKPDPIAAFLAGIKDLDPAKVTSAVVLIVSEGADNTYEISKLIAGSNPYLRAMMGELYHDLVVTMRRQNFEQDTDHAHQTKH